MLAIDSSSLSAAVLRELAPAVLIDTVGPFQARDRKLAELCIDLGIHYVDLADGREFVQNVVALNAAAVRHNVLVVSGASTVPALSSAVVEHLAAEFSDVEETTIGIPPPSSSPLRLP